VSRACADDVAAYVLGALEPQEADAFRRHLEQCAVCRDELETFQHVVDALPMSVEQHRAPPQLRRRILALAEAEPKLHATPPAATSQRRRPQWLARPAFAMAAVAVVAAIVIGAVSLSSSGTRATRVYAAQVNGLPGTAQVRVTNGRGVLVVRHFPAPPPGKIYEVWLARPHRAPQPTNALFSVTAAGAADVAVPGSLHGVNQVMVTPEPAGGSRAPTHPPVIQAKLA
jgi:anti-sigma-K factor RskA